MAPPREVMYYLDFFGKRRFSGTITFWKKIFGKVFFFGKKNFRWLTTDLRSVVGPDTWAQTPGVVRRMVLRRMVL